MNSWNAVGRLVADPDIRLTETQNTIARFTIAINRREKGKADFIPCVAFGKTAELIEKYFRKGDRIGVHGEIRIDTFTDREGQKRKDTKAVLDAVEFLQEKREEPKQQTFDDYGVPENVSEEDLPF